MRERIPSPHGRVRAFRVDEAGRRGPLFGTHNLTLVEWGGIAALCLSGDRDYRLRAMYFEYENVASPGDVVMAPSFTKYEGSSYYTGLSASASRDFVRSALIGSPTVGVETGYEDYFSGSVGNVLTCYAQTSGVLGTHGKAYSNAANSKVFGAALVATPSWADQTRDLVFARVYFDAADQLLKEASGQIGLEWELPFTV